MKKLLLSVIALAFTAGVSTSILAASHVGPKDDKLAAACKDKKPGTSVKVDGKDVKCPAEKKDAKK
jgi:hypothetical protein